MSVLACLQGRRTGPSNAVCPDQPRHPVAPPSGNTLQYAVLGTAVEVTEHQGLPPMPFSEEEFIRPDLGTFGF